jgi:hypothetical protein
VPPGTYTVETAVADLVSQTASARRDTFLGREAEPLQVSDVMTVKTLEPAEGPPGDDPLRFGGARVAPSLASALPVGGREGTLPLFFRVSPAPGIAGSPEVSIEVKYNGSAAGQSKLPDPNEKSAAGLPYLATIPTRMLRPGHYEFIATAVHGTARAERRLELDIEWAPGADRHTAAVTAGSAPGGDEQSASDDDEPAGALPVTPVVELPGAQPPEPSEQDAMIAILRERALGYVRSLPNFFCVQVTKRLEDASSSGKWKERDELRELLTYVDGHENYKELKMANAEGADGTREKGVSSRGELGGILLAIFDPKAQAEVRWKAWSTIQDAKVHVFSYRVEQANSKYALSWSGRWERRNYWEHHPGYEGLIFVDPETLRIRRLTLKADKVPHRRSRLRGSGARRYADPLRQAQAAQERDSVSRVPRVGCAVHHSVRQVTTVAGRSGSIPGTAGTRPPRAGIRGLPPAGPPRPWPWPRRLRATQPPTPPPFPPGPG